MKKVISSIMIFVFMLLSCVSCLEALPLNRYIHAIGFKDTEILQGLDSKIISNATLDDEFSEKFIIVVLNHKATFSNKQYTVKDFPNIKLKSVEDLTSESFELIKKQINKPHEYENDPMRLDTNQYRRILKLTLQNQSKENVLSTLKSLETRSDFISVEPDYFFTNNSFFPNEFNYLSNSQKTNLETINAPQAWGITNGSQVKVAVIDTGIYNHPDLLINHNLSQGFAGQANVYTDYNGHGTAVAGIIGSIGNNNQGTVGVAWGCEMVSLKVQHDDLWYWLMYQISGSTIYKAIENATVKSIPIINLSMGILNNVNATKQAIINYPGVLVYAAGNENLDLDGFPNSPEAFNLPNMLVVGATDSNDNFADWYSLGLSNNVNSKSNFGANTVDIFAPGTQIYSTLNNNSYGLFNGHGSGTSFAAPHVAGVAALIKSKYPNLTATQIKQAIMNGADPVASLADKCYSGGRLNAHQALLEAEKLLEPLGMVSGDFTGNGLDDIAYFYDLGNNTMAIKVAVKNGTTFTPQTWYTHPQGTYLADRIPGRVVAGDFNGDGKTDIAIMQLNWDNSTSIHVWLSTGNSFTYIDAWWYAPANQYDANRARYRIVSGDFNGDGKDDIAVIYDQSNHLGNGRMSILVFLSTGTSFSSFISWFDAFTPNSYYTSALSGRVV
ncbi:MAG: S8 family serine peptidase, partial [Firmicutes bacterium]|nr:S8 family serine peptidase [Bacillota bacterium]